MKKVLKINALIAIISLIGMTVFGLVARNDLRNHLTYEPLVGEYDPDEIKVLNINVDNRNIIIGPSLTGKINLSFYVSNIDTYTLNTNNDTVSLDIKTPWFQGLLYSRTIFNLSFDPEISKIMINVPTGALDNFKVRTANGKIEVNDLTTNIFNAQTSNGTISVKNTLTSSTTLTSANGSVILNEFNSTNLNIQTSNGEIKGDYVISPIIRSKTDNGQIKFIDVTTDDLSTTTSNGNIILRVNGVFTDFKTTVSTTNGTIKIDDQKYSNGTYNVGQVKTISALTSNGYIRLNFS
ncbi:MAG: DUF4097 family beta strand repeat protein [Erysipelotrichia bacterium]|jgi:DUF4097 and DUF4098 domain-containing protein YvlB|nr:DUF4097 family beta strand repeat protein [Erysipelotrichia bacterium]